jgi:thioredoxin reductase (NADPH)
METIGGDLKAMTPQPFRPEYLEAMRQVGASGSIAAGEPITPVGQRMDRFMLVLDGEVDIMNPFHRRDRGSPGRCDRASSSAS